MVKVRRLGFHFTLCWAGLQAQALTAVRAVLGRAALPTSREARFGVLPPASESRGVELPAKPQEQDGKENQQEAVEIEQVAVHRL